MSHSTMVSHTPLASAQLHYKCINRKMCRLAIEERRGQMKGFLSVIWGLLTAWTVVSTFTGYETTLGIIRILATLIIIALCIWKNTIPDLSEWVILGLSIAVILILWLMAPNFPISVILLNQTVREITFFGAVIVSLLM